MRGEISERPRRTKCHRPHFTVRFLDCARNDRVERSTDLSTSPPLAKGGLRGDLPLRDKVRLSESSIFKTPTAFLWGQTLPVYCALLSKPPPLAKGRLVVDRTLQSDFSTMLEMTVGKKSTMPPRSAEMTGFLFRPDLNIAQNLWLLHER